MEEEKTVFMLVRVTEDTKKGLEAICDHYGKSTIDMLTTLADTFVKETLPAIIPELKND